MSSVTPIIVYSVRVPSLTFVGLSMPKLWLIFGHAVKRPGDLDLLTCKCVMGHPCNGLPSYRFSISCVLPFST